MRTLMTGMRATGVPHIGNYWGSIKPIIQMQEEYQIFQVVADLHAIPHVKDPIVLNHNVRVVTACMLACGMDPNRTVIWRQSRMSEMAWISSIFSTLTTTREMDILMSRNDDTEMDMLSYMYPILMSADTLMVGADCVLAGIDHTGSLSFITQIAERFNNQYCEILRIPQSVFPPLKEMVIGLDGRKMSKSLNNTISILEPEESLYRMIVQSGSRNRLEEKVLEYHLKLLELFVTRQQLESIKQCVDQLEINLVDVNQLLFNYMNEELAPIRQRYDEIMSSPSYVDDVLAEGLKKVKLHTSSRVKQILKCVGLYTDRKGD